MRGAAACVCLLLTLLPATLSSAIDELVVAANRIRAECPTAEPGPVPLAGNEALSRAAGALADGAELAAAVAEAGYAASRAVSIRVRSSGGAGDVVEVLARRYCETLSDPALVDVGVSRRADETWLILAAPRVTATQIAGPELAKQVIEHVNDARSSARRCGRSRFPAAAPLEPDGKLDEAALGHARDMAARALLTHQGGDGSRPAERVRRAGFDWSAVAENVAAGHQDAETVVAGWLDSPGHCSNLMDARYTHTGSAVAVSDDGAAVFWVQVFATPR